MKKLLKALGILLLAVVACAVFFIAFLTLREYRPADEEPLSGFQGPAPAQGASLRILSWNIGYAGLDKNADFFMDGGKSVRSADRSAVERNLTAMADRISSLAPDFTLLQEVDSDSSRTYSIDQRESFTAPGGTYALNYSCDFVPFPLPPIGKVHSGLLTLSNYGVSSASRVALPCPFSWPVSAANLKRCLLIDRIPLEGTDKELVLINLHLEAYDNGEGKAAQTALLKERIEAEYAAGNYVIAGGDFNQSFPDAVAAYPVKNAELWTPGLLSDDDLSEGWHFAYDVSVPSCRLLNQPYDPADPATQYYVIDGFILSPNVTLQSVQTLDLAFEHSDHNPVLLQAVLD